ncbi:hypothetical protein HPB48_000024 [Haemaphysalis longicornis]|uniref:Uncharacterized protein n=1 Tax=Haemaphysalis longicornis TaxID=44386 RepID=A0A9J6FQI7_HAELO|nr:hypothetical protein HPB48_000024 [Haemaphysalis longicornis]
MLRAPDIQANLLSSMNLPVGVCRTQRQTSSLPVSRVLSGARRPQLELVRTENFDRYAAVEHIDVRGKSHAVRTYKAAPHGSVMGLIRDIALEDTPQEIQENVVHEFNPTAPQANRIGKTLSVVIAFAGMKVPRYIRAARPAREDFKTSTSFVDAGGRRSIPIKETTKEEETETREVLQADPTIAARRGAEEVRRRRPGAATPAIRAAPGRNLGCGAAQVAVSGRSQSKPERSGGGGGAGSDRCWDTAG